MAGDIIVVNTFVFCEDHGLELCHRCCYDHRMTNNYQIEDDLGDLYDVGFDLEDRQQFNVYALGAIEAGKKKKETTYKCYLHETVDCKECFDWVGMIKREAGVVEPQAKPQRKDKPGKKVSSMDEVD